MKIPKQSRAMSVSVSYNNSTNNSVKPKFLLDKGAFPFHGLCTDSADLGSVLSFTESAAEVAVYFSGGAAFYILLDAVFRIFLVLCRPHGELFCDLRLYRGNYRLPHLAESFADGTASGGSV